MKRVILLISLGFLIICGCMVYLLRTGISLRAATLIKPSIADENLANVASGVMLRMYPEFDSSHYILWGVSGGGDEAKLLELLRQEYQNIFHLNVNILADAEKQSLEQIKNCPKPCWLITTPEKANELEGNEFIESKILPLVKGYTNISVLPFSPEEKAPDYCLNEKRLTFLCLKSLSVQGARRKIKTSQRHFFLKKYNHHDFFLFLQEPLK